MSKVLKMTFQLDDNKTVSYNLNDPKDGLTKAEVDAAMQLMIDKQAIVSGGVSPTGIKEAVIRETSETALA